MQDQTKRETGISMVAGALLLVVVLLIGFVGWYIWQTNNKTSTTSNGAANASSQTAASSTAGATVPAAEKTALVQAATAWCTQTAGNTVHQTTVSKYEAGFAAVSVACGNTQVGWRTTRLYLKQTSGNWAVVVTGAGAPTTSAELQPYGFPANFLQ